MNIVKNYAYKTGINYWRRIYKMEIVILLSFFCLDVAKAK